MAYNPSQNTHQLLRRAYAESTRRTIFFVGAGGSAESGVPTWTQLREDLHRQIDQIITEHSDEKDLESFRELEELRDKNDFWGYFSKAEMHWATTYKDYLEEVFDRSIEQKETPVVYKKLWEMKNVHQILTLNVDGLIERAFKEVDRTYKNTLLQYDGYAITDSQAFFARNAYCLLNLHGTIFQKSRWIMNETERRRLYEGESGKKYKAFLTWLFQSHNMVFVGINPQDIAISHAIQTAEKTGLLGKHFWICPTPSPDVKRWAQKNDIRLIEYVPQKDADGNSIHSSDICAILDDLERFIASDPPIELPIRRDAIDPSSIPDPQNLVGKMNSDRRDAMTLLDGAATHIGREHGFSSPPIDDFIKKNTIAIQIATSLDTTIPQFDQLFEYKLVSKVQGGGSSTVWLCEDIENDGNYVIAKVLNGNRHEDKTERQSFRRGIESLYLLNDLENRVSPKYISHIELPLSVIMENIPGSTLFDVVSNSEIESYLDGIKLFLKICNALRICHLSDGNVLHRDLKPGNIIFTNWYPGYEVMDLLLSEIRLINFDLSWHRFSIGNTKAISADEAGYYAPEQKGSRNTLPPRSASTDVYMLGMIFYFLISGEHPPEGGAGLADWEKRVSEHVNRNFEEKIVRNRVLRIIMSMTKTDMTDRTDIEAVIADASNILAFKEKRISDVDHDFLVENILCSFDRRYVWDSGRLEGRIMSVPQTELKVRYVQRGMRCEIEFFRTRDDGATRASFGEKISRRIQNARQMLVDAGWDCDIEGGNLKSLKASIQVSVIAGREDLGTSEMTEIGEHLLSHIE